MSKSNNYYTLDDSSEWRQPCEFVQDDLLKSKKNNKQQNTILPALDGLPYSDDIKREAERIYQMKGLPMHRAGRLKRIVYLCLFEAHRNLGRTCNPHQLKEVVGLKSSTLMNSVYSLASKCSSETPFSTQTNIDLSNKLSVLTRQQTPFDFIKLFSNETRLCDAQTLRVNEFCKDILLVDPSLEENVKPQLLAAGIITCFLEYIKVEDIPDFASIIGSNKSSVESIKKKIKSIAVLHQLIE